MTEVIASGHPGGTQGVKATLPTRECRSEKCEVRAHIGVFFDGTGNNQDWIENASVNWRTGLINWWNEKPANTRTQLQQRADSNVARLFRAYRDDPLEGYFPLYVPGVGTPCREVGEDEPAGMGAGFGAGGDARINYGLLHVLNSMYRAIAIANRPYFGADTVRALCSTGATAINARTGQPNLSQAKQDALLPVGMNTRGGLLMDNSHHGNRVAFFREQFANLAEKIASVPKPQLVEVFIDVFGFSRGAAQARTFCNWLEPFFQGSRLAGVTAHIRFLGIFDTVAAVGLGPTATSFTEGHQSWGDAPYLRIPGRVGHCEHYVAMHENRGAFSLEDCSVANVMPGNCRQYRSPGMHSDVGGGYSPTDQGRGPNRRDDEKLSQVPLNFMFDAAVVAKVPLDKDLAVQSSGWDCYAKSSTLQATYDTFMSTNGMAPRPLKECLMDYLAWRYQVRDRYGELAATRRAAAGDRADLIGANATLIADMATVSAAATIDQRLASARQNRVSSRELQRLVNERRNLSSQMSDLSPFAAEIGARLRAYRAIQPAEAAMFGDYCHDSYAGFKPFDAPVALGVDAPGTWEPEGYIRYRTRYSGGDTRLTLRLPDGSQKVVDYA